MIKFINDHKGGVTVFVTLILVPAILFVGVFLDLAVFMSTNMQDPLALEAESVLANYNGLLKEVYGLYAIKYNEGFEEFNSAISAINTNPFHSSGDKVNNLVENDNYFDPHNVKIHYNEIYSTEGANLSNINILQTQISDYMKYRAPAIIFSELANLEGLSNSIKGAAEDAEAVEKSTQVTESLQKMHTAGERLYKSINEFDNYDINSKTVELVNNTNKNIDSLRSLVDQLNSLSSSETDDNDDARDNKENQINDIKTQISDVVEDINTFTPKADAIIEKAKTLADVIEVNAKGIINVQKKVEVDYKEFVIAYNNSSAEMKKGFSETKEDFDKVISADFSAVLGVATQRIEGIDSAFDAAKNIITTNYSAFNQDVASCVNINIINISWKKIKDNSKSKQVYDLLYSWYGVDNTGIEISEKAEKDFDHMLKQQQEENEKSAENVKGAKKIPDAVFSQLMSQQKTEATSGTGIKDAVKEVNAKYNKSMMDSVLNFGLDIANKMFLVEYDLAMFSSATTGNKKDDENKGIVEDTISGIPKTHKMNYLFQSEQEYLFSGGKTAVGNIIATQSLMLGILTARNFAASFSNKELSGYINGICALIPSPPLQLAARIVLRLAASGTESVFEINNLKNGGEAELVKSTWYLSFKDNITVGGKLELKGVTFEYEHLMRIFLLVFVPEQTLLRRTGSLIELNMTNYELKCNANNIAMEQLTFETENAMVALESTIVYTISPLMNAAKMLNLKGNIYDKAWSQLVGAGY